jgi:hypothetical protein
MLTYGGHRRGPLKASDRRRYSVTLSAATARHDFLGAGSDRGRCGGSTLGFTPEPNIDLGGGTPFGSSSQAIVQPSAVTASRSMHSQARGTPRGCRPVCRSGRVDGGIDSAMRTSARQPSATAPSRCRFLCGASPAAAECDACASRPGWLPRRSAMAENEDWPAPESAAFALQGRNRIEQGQAMLIPSHSIMKSMRTNGRISWSCEPGSR